MRPATTRKQDVGDGALRRPARPRPLWNQRELTVHAAIYGLVPWIAVVALLAVPGLAQRYGHRPGSDFVHFYILGHAALARDGQLLYDAARQQNLQETFEPSQPGWYVPIYAPQTSLIFAPLAACPYTLALWLWRALTVVGFGLAVWMVWRDCPGLRGAGLVVLIAAAGFPPLRQLLIYGQSTLIPLVALALARIALRSQRDLAAGAALALLLVKPQLGLVFGAWAVVERRWLVILGGILSATAQVLAVWAWFGQTAITGYIGMLDRLSRFAPLLEPDVGQLHSLRGFLTPLLPARVVWLLWAVLSLGIVWVAIRAWRSPAGFDVRYAVLLLATGLVSPHLAGYDVVLLAPAFVAIAGLAVAEPRARAVAMSLYASYLLLLVPSGFFVPVQLSVLALALLLLTTVKIVSQRRADCPAPVCPPIE